MFLASVFFLHRWKVNSKLCSFYICLWNTDQILQTGTSSDDGLILLDFPQFCGKKAFQVMKVNFLIIQLPITKQSCLIFPILLKEMLFKIWKFGLCPTWKSRCNFPQFSLWIWQRTKIFQSHSNTSGNLSRTLIHWSIDWKDEVDVRRVEIMLNMCFPCLDSSPKHHRRVGNFAGQTQGSTVLRTDL